VSSLFSHAWFENQVDFSDKIHVFLRFQDFRIKIPDTGGMIIPVNCKKRRGGHSEKALSAFPLESFEIEPDFQLALTT